LQRIEKILLEEEPDLVIVFGDTNTTLAGALAASKLHIPVGHIEAGLRSFDRDMPEEVNRVLTDHCSTILFCPTKTAVANLENEGVTDGVYLVGDVMVDALEAGVKIAEQKSVIPDRLGLVSGEYLLATVHRAENTDNPDRLRNIVEALSEIENLVFPCHPRTENAIKRIGLWDRVRDSAIKPVGYFDMLMLERNARKILTDSGGVQKEAYVFKVPCITLRDNTEWVETVEDGWNVLVGADKGRISRAVGGFECRGVQRAVFGGGDASGRIG